MSRTIALGRHLDDSGLTATTGACGAGPGTAGVTPNRTAQCNGGIKVSMISLAGIGTLAQQAAVYHHPHYRGAVRSEFNRVIFDFTPFTGAEDVPTLPHVMWDDDSLPQDARNLLIAEYDEARSLWRNARYVLDLKSATDGGTVLWGGYLQAREQMDEVFAALDTTPDTGWRSTVSRLVTAQEKAVKAANAWDEMAERIAVVHEEFLYSDLPQREAYRLAGIDATGWYIGYASDYHSCSPTPLVRKVTMAIEEQREHLRKVASLSSDRGLV